MFQANPYQGMSTLFHDGKLLMQNSKGQLLPHALVNFTQLPANEQEKIVPASLLNELRQLPQYQPNQGTGMPNVSKGAGPASSQSSGKAKVVAQDLLAKEKSEHHQFQFQNKTVSFKRAKGPANPEGISRYTELSKEQWSQIENFITKYLNENDGLVPKDATHICDLGFAAYERANSAPQILFEVYYREDGVLKRACTPVKNGDFANLRKLASLYPKLMIPKFAQVSKRTEKYSKGQLHPSDPSKPSLAIDLMVKRSQNTDQCSDPRLLCAIHQAAEEGRKLSRKSESMYSYCPQVDTAIAEDSNWVGRTQNKTLSTLPSVTIGAARGKIADDEVRMIYNVSPRCGLIPQEFENEHLHQFSQKHPLHFCISASLGHLESALAPRTAHLRDVLISTKETNSGFSFFPKPYQTVFLVGNQVAQDLKITDNGELTNKNLLDALLTQLLRLNKAKEPHLGRKLKELTIADTLEVENLTQNQLKASIFIRILAVMIENATSAETDPKLKLDFTIPDTYPSDVKVTLRDEVLSTVKLIEEHIKDDPLRSVKDLLNILMQHLNMEFFYDAS